MILYHIPQNSFYVQIYKVRYVGDEYFKFDLLYLSKTTLTVFAKERSVKVRKDVLKHWHKIELSEAIKGEQYDRPAEGIPGGTQLLDQRE